jgi:DNA primase
VTGQIPVGLVRSAFFDAMAVHFGWPAAELESTLRAQAPPPKPAPPAVPSAPSYSGAGPRPLAPTRPTPATPVQKLEAWYVTAILREPRLMARDAYRLYDELSHPGLRLVLAQATTGLGVQDALFEAPEPVKRVIEHHLQLLPPGGLELEQAFSKICRQLVLKRIDERLSYIKRATEQTPGSFDLTEETRQLLAERIELLALKKRIDEETRDPTSGTKVPMQPV